MGLIGKLLPPVPKEAYKKSIEQSLSELQAWGVTSFIDMVVNEPIVDAYFEFEEQGQFPFRVNLALGMNDYTQETISAEQAKAIFPEIVSRSTDKISTSHFKYWADGTPLSYTSKLVDKYADRDSYGEITMNDEMREMAISLLGQGMGGHVHAVADGSIRWVLDMLEEAHKRYPGKVGRFHIGHKMLIHPDDFKRYKDMDVVAEIGPAMWFPSPIQNLVEEKLGEERSKRWFDVRSMIDAGLNIAWGSDWPSGTPDANPLRGLESLVTRSHPWGQQEGIWGTPISLEEGLYILTMGGAYAMEREDSIGSIEVGKHADFIVLEQDLFKIKPEDIDSTRVLQSYFSGELRYQLK